MQYWCKDETERERLKQVYSNNDKEYQKELEEKYSVDNIFKNRNNTVETKASNESFNLPIEVKKEKWYEKMFLFFKGLFRKK